MTHPTHLTNKETADLTAWRRMLHRAPELSGQEVETARKVVAFVEETKPTDILTGLGGHGVAAIYDSGEAGPAVLLRCELDGLPIEELNPDLPHVSEISGKGHLCGHDGHMAIISGVARWLHRNPPHKGRVTLMYQPAEEDGSGAAKVIGDPRFAQITPDYALSLHNFPGLPLGHAVVASGPMNCASRGIRITLTGRTAHASQPETGVSPALAIAELIQRLVPLASGTDTFDPDFALVTVTHASLGEPAFGIAPGQAELWATLRTQKDATMDRLVAKTEGLVNEIADRAGLQQRWSYHDVFHHCENDAEATGLLRDAVQAEGIPMTTAELPMRGSEDFGRFGSHAKAAMFLLGSGEGSPSLHNPDFDFPDDLIPIGVRIFVRALKNLCYCPET